MNPPTSVILVAPEMLALDESRGPAALVFESGVFRLLVRLAKPVEPLLLSALKDSGAPVEFLLGPLVEAPDGVDLPARMPPGTTPQELDEFALALADAVLAAPEAAETTLVRLAKMLGNPIVTPGSAPPGAPALLSVMRRLDPEQRGWHAWGRGIFGRFEQGALELFAFNWLGRKHGGIAESRSKLGNCVRLRWRPNTHFAPEKDCRERNLDRGVLDPAVPIVAGFAAFDRSALHGSYLHRDLIWLMHLGAALAVLAAVAGHLSENRIGWGVVELLALVVVGLLVFWARMVKLQERWTACRLGAEQLRIARMCLPLFVVPPALTSVDTIDGGTEASRGKIDFGLLALAEVKHMVRKQGLPRLDAACTPADAARCLHLIVDDQTTYHHRNYRKLEHAERRLGAITNGLFFAAVIAVVADFNMRWDWLLLITAAGPAFAAACHGTLTHLGVVHCAALSRGAEQELRPIGHALPTLMACGGASPEAWRDVRRLAARAAEAMGRENLSWHSLVRRYTDLLP